MRRLAILASGLWLTLLLGGAVHAGILPPFVIGADNGSPGTNDLTFHTTIDCPASATVFVAVGQFGPHTSVLVQDSVSNTYGSTNTNFDDGSGNSIKGAGWINTINGSSSVAVPSGTLMTITYGSTSVYKTAIAVCVIGTRIGPMKLGGGSLGPEGVMGPPNNDTSSNPNIPIPAQNPFLYYGQIVFVLTLVTNGDGDTWAESTGFNTLKSINSTHATHLSYMIVYGTVAPSYSATNGVSRAWAANYMPYIPGLCGLSSSGTGTC
jgi:hypothetical protein